MTVGSNNGVSNISKNFKGEYIEENVTYRPELYFKDQQ